MTCRCTPDRPHVACPEHGDLEAVASTLDALVAVGRAEDRLREMSDRDVARLLKEHVLDQTGMLSPQYALIEQAVERLRRADRGPNPEADIPTEASGS